MCIAAIIFEPVSLEYLEAMDHDNPHGGGVAWEQDGKIRFIKGLNAKDVHQFQQDGVLRYPYLLHFRWATHGARVAELTHPFVLGPRALMGETSGECNALMIHNGTWSNYDRFASKALSEGNFEFPEEILNEASDTAIAAWLALDNPDILDMVPWATAVAEIRDTTDEHGEPTKTMDITTRGTWSEKEGNWYSNLNWVPYYGTGYYMANSWRNNDSVYTEWAKEYFKQEKEDAEKARKDTSTWGESHEPYATRKEEDTGLSWEEYVKKYGAPTDKDFTKPASKARSETDYSKMAWDEYLVAKYGPDVAAEIEGCFTEDDLSEGNLSEGSLADELAADIDPDLVSEDWETVNSILARQMCRGG